jgi:hypothetical protein
MTNVSNLTVAANENHPAYAIEVSGIAAGLALRERGGFSFVAADPRFRLLEGSRFRRVEQVEAAARNLARAVHS